MIFFSFFDDTRGAKNVTSIADATEESSVVSGLNIAENVADEKAGIALDARNKRGVMNPQ